MVVAFVLLVTEIGKEHDVLKALSRLEGVTEVRLVYGNFDIVTKLETPDLESLDRAISQIRRMPAITRTVTLIST